MVPGVARLCARVAPPLPPRSRLQGSTCLLVSLDPRCIDGAPQSPRVPTASAWERPRREPHGLRCPGGRSFPSPPELN